MAELNGYRLLVVNRRVAERLRRVRRPVLYVRGEKDPFGAMDVTYKAQRPTFARPSCRS